MADAFLFISNIIPPKAIHSELFSEFLLYVTFKCASLKFATNGIVGQHCMKLILCLRES